MAMPNIAPGSTKRIAVRYLKFDRNNPRFTPDRALTKATDVDIVRSMMERDDLTELLQSVAENGYVDLEPLIGLRNKDGYVVLEGNRRLAAIRLLAEPNFAKKCSVDPPTIKPEHKNTLAEVQVHVVAERSDARALIGFKHINGPQRWDSLAKARFAAQWFREGRQQGITIQQIARSMGDGHATIRRLVHGLCVLEQAEKQGIYSVADRYPRRGFAFSHLYTALTKPSYRKFVGLAPDSVGDDPKDSPIPKSHRRELRQLMIWLYGSKSDDIAPAIESQNPDLGRLAEVLDAPAAKKIMLATSRLVAAYAEVRTDRVQFEEALLNAHKFTEDAMSKVTGFDGKDETLFEFATKLQDKSSVLLSVMTQARRKVTKK